MANIVFYENGQAVARFEIIFVGHRLVINGVECGNFEGASKADINDVWLDSYFSHSSNPISSLFSSQPKSKPLTLEFFKRLLVEESDVPNLRFSRNSAWASRSDSKYVFNDNPSELETPSWIIMCMLRDLSEKKETPIINNVQYPTGSGVTIQDIPQASIKNVVFPQLDQPQFTQVEQPQFPQVEQAQLPQAQFPQVERAQFPQVEQAQFPQVEQAQFPQVEQAQFLQVEQAQFPQVEQPEFHQVHVQFPQTEQVEELQSELVEEENQVEGIDEDDQEYINSIADKEYYGAFNEYMQSQFVDICIKNPDIQYSVRDLTKAVVAAWRMSMEN